MDWKISNTLNLSDNIDNTWPFLAIMEAFSVVPYMRKEGSVVGGEEDEILGKRIIEDSISTYILANHM